MAPKLDCLAFSTSQGIKILMTILTLFFTVLLATISTEAPEKVTPPLTVE